MLFSASGTAGTGDGFRCDSWVWGWSIWFVWGRWRPRLCTSEQSEASGRQRTTFGVALDNQLSGLQHEELSSVGNASGWLKASRVVRLCGSRRRSFAVYTSLGERIRVQRADYPAHLATQSPRRTHCLVVQATSSQ
jgi:hypothetical protein